MKQFEVTATYRITAESQEKAQAIYEEAGPEIDDGAPIQTWETSELAEVADAPVRWTLVVEVADGLAPSDLLERLQEEPGVRSVEFHFEDMIERGDNVDVCLAGNPAVDGVCGDPDCVCAR